MWLFIPLKTARAPVGVLGVQMTEDADMPSPEQMRLLETLADQAAVAIERTILVADIEAARVATERERLRSALLSSLSHDLRTPLVSTMGAASSLITFDAALDGTDRRELAQTIQDEADRLNRFVQNLLDTIKLGAGALQPRVDWADLHEMVGAAVQRAARLARAHAIRVEIAPDLPLLRVDPVLMEQVFFNLLDNACKYSPPGTVVKVWAMRTEDRESALPILVLSVRADELDRVEALKPFGVGELMARIRALLRTRAGTDAADVVELGALRVDFSRRVVTRAGGELHLSRKEWESAGPVRPPPGPRADPQAHPEGGLGAGPHRRHRLSARLCQAAPPEARGRSRPAPAAGHRSRRRVPAEAGGMIRTGVQASRLNRRRERGRWRQR